MSALSSYSSWVLLPTYTDTGVNAPRQEQAVIAVNSVLSCLPTADTTTFSLHCQYALTPQTVAATPARIRMNPSWWWRWWGGLSHSGMREGWEGVGYGDVSRLWLAVCARVTLAVFTKPKEEAIHTVSEQRVRLTSSDVPVLTSTASTTYHHTTHTHDLIS